MAAFLTIDEAAPILGVGSGRAVMRLANADPAFPINRGTSPALMIEKDLLTWLSRSKEAPKTNQDAARVILGKAIPLPAGGVYCLINRGQIVYVGMTGNLISRLAQHIQSKEFDSYAFIPSEKDTRGALEKRLIRDLCPPLNRKK